MMNKTKKFIFIYVALFLITLSSHYLWTFNYKFQNFIKSLTYKYYSTFGFDENKKILSVHFYSKSGIGNRLKKMTSYLRYYKPEKLKIYWPNDGWVSASFSDLFTFEYPIELEEINTPILINNNHPEANPLFDYIRNWVLIVSKEDFPKNVEPFAIDVMYNNIPQNIRDIYIPYFTSLKPSNKVKKRLNDVKIPSKFVSVQIRNAPDFKQWFGVDISYSYFFEIMDKYDSDTYFYLSAMSKEAALPFYTRYPGRIIELPNKNYKSMIDATTDLFILGSSEETICSYMSTFCEVAWWINGAKSKVSIVGTEEKYKNHIVEIKMFDSIP